MTIATTLRGLVAIAGIAVATIGVSQGLSTKLASPDLHFVSYTLPQGKITLITPNDVLAGDTITGTVVAEPKGKNAAEKEKNEGILQGYVISAGEAKAKPGQALTFAVPILGVKMILDCFDPKGKPVGSQPIPIQPRNPFIPQNYELPEFVQPGKPIVIEGDFNGDGLDTVLKVGGDMVPIIAESPRGAVALCPVDLTIGSQSFGLSEKGMKIEDKVRCVSIELYCETTLLRGQSTSVRVTVRGLEGYDEVAVLEIKNATPNVVRMSHEGVPIEMKMLELAPFGDSETARTLSRFSLTGTGQGSFEIACQLTSNKCGAQTHQMFIVGPSKGKDKDGYHVEWKEVCYLGTCYLRKGHAGAHKYSWKKCADHKEIPHKETFAKKEDRDARHDEVEKDRDKRKAANGFEG